jgi:hypothetical protein
VVIADVNGDGNPDLVSANTQAGFQGARLTTWLGNGDGTFGTAIGSDIGSGSTGLVLGDFNGDGKLDVAPADYYNSTVSIGLGNGDGTFTPTGSYSTGAGSSPWKIAAGNIAGNGRLDLAVVSPYTGQAAVFVSNGDGTFQSARYVALGQGTRPSGIALADVNGDGLADLTVANQDANTVAVYPSAGRIIHLGLYNSPGRLLALGGQAANLDQVVSDFVAPAAGTYYAHLTGVGQSAYGLAVTRGAAFDTEPHAGLTGVQDLHGNTAVLGSLSVAAPDDWYSISVNVGDTLTVSTSTPAGDPQQPGEPENALDPAVRLYDPSGHLVASDNNSGLDGKNASLTYTALAPGLYRVRVLATHQTTGDYVLRVQGATGVPAKFTDRAT